PVFHGGQDQHAVVVFLGSYAPQIPKLKSIITDIIGSYGLQQDNTDLSRGTVIVSDQFLFQCVFFRRGQGIAKVIDKPRRIGYWKKIILGKTTEAGEKK